MKTSTHSGRYRSLCTAAVVAALAVILSSVPRAARAQVCEGDCSGTKVVSVTQLILLVNIALGNAAAADCTMGIPAGQQVDIAFILKAVHNALNSCGGGAGICGDGNTNTGEDCDDGGTCMGGTNAGTHCTAESQCQGDGICVLGAKTDYVCSSDSDCPDGKCVHCKTFGGDGCAANCTFETTTTTNLKPGVVTDALDIMAGTSGAVAHGSLDVPLPLTGSQTLISGKIKDGRIPLTQKPSGVMLPRIPVANLACACVRGQPFKTCGGTRFEKDGTASKDCTPNLTTGDSECTGNKPCAFVFGPGGDGQGNSGEGVIACDSLKDISYSVVQDGCLAGSGPCGAGDVFTGTPGPPVVTFMTDTGGPGSAVIRTASTIGTVVGLCDCQQEPCDAAYGPDKSYCTDDDPVSGRGTVSVTVLTTGTASAEFVNQNFTKNDAANPPLGPFSYTGSPAIDPGTGQPVSCTDLEAGKTSGLNTVGAFTTLNPPANPSALGDVVVVNRFVTQ